MVGIGTKETPTRDRPNNCLQGGNRVLCQLALKHHQRFHNGKQRTRRTERRHVPGGERRAVSDAVDSTCVSDTHGGDVLSGEARDDSAAGVVRVDEELARRGREGQREEMGLEEGRRGREKKRERKEMRG